MEHTCITGNVLIRHGFEYWGRHLYSLALPVENFDLNLEWESVGCFALRLKSIWVGKEVTDLDLPEYLYHDLEYIKTLELLKEFHLLLTGKPLVALAENDAFYMQQLSDRTHWLREQSWEEDPDALEATGAFEPIELKGTSSAEINPESLKEEGFSYRNHRYELMLYSERSDTKKTISCTDLVWEEEKGLYLEYYYDSMYGSKFSLPHIQSIGSLQNLKVLLTSPLSQRVQVSLMTSENWHRN